MSARDYAREAHDRFLATILELDLDYCQNTYGSAPCTASGSAGNECYRTFGTCQDKPNFSRGTKTYRFCGRGMPIPAGVSYRPYLVDLSASPTEISPRSGIARSAKTDVTLQDEPDSDVDSDPYFATRAQPPGSTYWARFLARNPYYSGRFARIRRGYIIPEESYVDAGYVVDGYVLPGSGRLVLNTSTLIDELYIIESIKPPDKSGQVSIVLKDILKLTDRTKIPVPTDGKLTGAITSTSLSITVEATKATQYGTSGWIRIGEEIIKFTSRSGGTLSWPDTSYRAQFGTTAASHSLNDKVQLCRVFENELLTEVVKKLLVESGIDTSYIDTAEMAREDQRWLDAKYRITACISEPDTPSTMIGELVRQANAFIWWHPTEQKVKFKVNMPESATAVVPEFNETQHFIGGTVMVEPLDDERLTYSAIHYHLVNSVASAREAKNFLRGAIRHEEDAESPEEYGDRRAEVIYSRWLTDTNNLAAQALVSRDVSWRRDTPFKVKFQLDPKDYTTSVGNLVDVNTKKLVDAAGNNKVARVRITRLVDRGEVIDIEARSTTFRDRFAYIAPNGTANYPTDTFYAHICVTATQKMSNGDDPYKII